MMKWKVWCNVWLVHFGIREIYPVDYIRSIKVKDCGEKMVNLTDYFDAQSGVLMDDILYARERVCLMLQEVVKNLPDGYVLKIKSAYRSLREQRQKWTRAMERTKLLYPNLAGEELYRKTREYCADPLSERGGGHQTGGALDVTLCIKAGDEISPLDMGTEIGEYSEKTKTENPHLDVLQRKNRTLLKQEMERVGFVNYPNEWWHYSYGDQMWCAYSRHKTAFYGKIEK